jgi:hypothetical protein
MKLVGWLAVELALIAFFVIGYVLYRRSRTRNRTGGNDRAD